MDFVWTDETLAINEILNHYNLGSVAGDESSEEQDEFIEIWIEPDYIDKYKTILRKLAYFYDIEEPIPHKVLDEIELSPGLLSDKIGFFYDQDNVAKLMAILDLVYGQEDALGLSE